MDFQIKKGKGMWTGVESAKVCNTEEVSITEMVLYTVFQEELHFYNKILLLERCER